MKRIFLTLCAALLALGAPLAQAQTPSPLITQTVGTGSNTSYFVINFDDGANNTDSAASDYAFAYHWNTSAAPTGETMLMALNQLTNPTLGVNQTYYASFDAYFVNGFTYLSHSQTGYYNSSTDQASWSYWVMDGGAWSQPQAYGVSGRPLFNGSYDGWTFHVGPGSASAPITPNAAPEPTSPAVFAGGGASLLLLICLRRRQGRCVS